MTNHRKLKHRRPIAGVNVVPYLDVLLVLLIILMATAPLLPKGVSLKLPQVTTQTLSTNHTPFVIQVDTMGQYYVERENTSAAITPDALIHTIRDQFTSQPDQNPTVWIKADQNVTYEKIVGLMALLQEAGIPQIGLVTL